MADGLNWSTLTLLNRTYIDDDARASELDLLFTIERGTDEEPLALYVLLEHQSEPSRYMRLRLLKYCCRIWEQAEQEAGQLRAIVPVVLYQGRRRWPWPTELSAALTVSLAAGGEKDRMALARVGASGILAALRLTVSHRLQPGFDQPP